MKISFVVIGLCLFALSFSHASSETQDQVSTIKEEKTFLKKPYFKHIPVPIYKPKPKHVPISVPIYKPNPVHVPVPVPVYIPKPTPISVPVYKPYPHPFYKKPLLHPHFTHPKKPCPPKTP